MTAEAKAWIAIFGGPLLWFVNLEATFAVAPLACGSSGRLPSLVIAVASLLLTASAVCLSSSAFTASEPPNTRKLAIGGAVVSGFALLVIFAQTLPVLVLGGCE